MIQIIAVLYSSSSGNNDVSLEKIRESFETHEKKLVMLEMADEIERSVEEIQKNKAKLIVAAGGDGTVNLAANIAVRANVPMAVVPLGTHNHFAKDLGLPLEYEEAVKTILSGHVEVIDYCKVNDHVFMNNSSIGMYPSSVKRRSGLEPKLGKWPATLFTFMWAITRLNTIRLDLELGKDRYTHKTPLLFVGNNSYEFERKGLLNRSNLTGGKLFVYMIRANRITTVIRLMFDAFLGRRQKNNDLMITTKEKLIVYSRRKRLDVAIDGEVKALQTPLVYSIHPHELTICKGR